MTNQSAIGSSTRSAAATGQVSDNVRVVAAATEALDGPLSALLLYVGEIRQHIDQFSQVELTRTYLRQVAENALEQTERACAIVKQFANAHQAPGAARAGDARRSAPHVEIMVASAAGQKPLTKREREVLNLISKGYSNKESARQMCISPRTFESHRAEIIRKLGARNTADLVRMALAHPAAANPRNAACTAA